MSPVTGHLTPDTCRAVLLRSFFGQWGPNATTWLLPSELFPTETRAMSHGLAAATGKVRSNQGFRSLGHQG